MEYYIIDKIEYLNGEVVYTQIGYTTDPLFKDQINEMYNDFFIFVNENKTGLESGTASISEFFTNGNYIYSNNTKTTSIDDMGLMEINL